MSNSTSALILGATGATGKHLLRSLLASNIFTRVGEYGRRVTPEDQVGDYTKSGKLVQKTIDFEHVADAGLSEGEWDVVYITLATSRAAAGSAAAFEKIDREYVLSAARAAKSQNPTRKQRLVYCSVCHARHTLLTATHALSGLFSEHRCGCLLVFPVHSEQRSHRARTREYRL